MKWHLDRDDWAMIEGSDRDKVLSLLYDIDEEQEYVYSYYDDFGIAKYNKVMERLAAIAERKEREREELIVQGEIQD